MNRNDKVSNAENEIQKQLVVRYDPGFLFEKTSRIFAGYLALLLFSAFVFMGRQLSEKSLWPLLLLILGGCFWGMYISISHKSIPEKVFFNLSTQERDSRIVYDSMWTRTYQAGIGFLVSGLLIWGMIEIGLSQNLFSTLKILVAVYIIFILFCIVRVQSLTKLAVEGPRKHKWLAVIFASFFIFVSVIQALPGLTNVVRVQSGQSALEIFILPLMTALTIFASFIFLISQFAANIAKVQYVEWKKLALTVPAVDRGS